MSRELLVRFANKSTKVAVSIIISLFTIFMTLNLSQAQDVGTSEPFKIVVLGDSLSAGYGLNPGEAFPEKLQKSLMQKYPNIIFKNAGVSGDTSSGGLARLDWSVAQGTNGVILELGANDALRGISPKLTADNLDKIVSRLKARNIKVLLTGMMAPPNMGEDYAKEFNPIYENLANKESLLLYPFFLEGVAGDTGLNQADGIHPTSQGLDIIVEKITPTIEQFISFLQN